MVFLALFRFAYSVFGGYYRPFFVMHSSSILSFAPLSFCHLRLFLFVIPAFERESRSVRLPFWIPRRAGNDRNLSIAQVARRNRKALRIFGELFLSDVFAIVSL